MAYEVVAEKAKERGITTAELARRVGMSAELLRRSLIGERRLLADEMVTLCGVLDIRLDEFQQVSVQ